MATDSTTKARAFATVAGRAPSVTCLWASASTPTAVATGPAPMEPVAAQRATVGKVARKVSLVSLTVSRMF